MDSLLKKNTKYANIVSRYIEELANEYKQILGTELEYQAVIDLKNNHFQFVRLGWSNRKFFYQILLHIDIKTDGKVWIQQNNTEISLKEVLEQRGVSKSDIIVGFRPAYLREDTELILS